MLINPSLYNLLEKYVLISFLYNCLGKIIFDLQIIIDRVHPIQI